MVRRKGSVDGTVKLMDKEHVGQRRSVDKVENWWAELAYRHVHCLNSIQSLQEWCIYLQTFKVT